MGSIKPFTQRRVTKYTETNAELKETPELRALRDETNALPGTMDVIEKDTPIRLMQTTPGEAQFLAMLIGLTGAKNIIEVGTFTGYGSLAIAQAMPPDGKLIACDISKEYTDIGKKYWKKAGVSDRIDLKLAPAQETLRKLLEDGGEGKYDLIFIDADKKNYKVYYEYALRLLRPGGLIVLDNMLWSGRVANPACKDADTLALRELNDVISHDTRLKMSNVLPVFDGLTIAQKKGFEQTIAQESKAPRTR